MSLGVEIGAPQKTDEELAKLHPEVFFALWGERNDRYANLIDLRAPAVVLDHARGLCEQCSRVSKLIQQKLESN